MEETKFFTDPAAFIATVLADLDADPERKSIEFQDFRTFSSVIVTYNSADLEGRTTINYKLLMVGDGSECETVKLSSRAEVQKIYDEIKDDGTELVLPYGDPHCLAIGFVAYPQKKWYCCKIGS